MKTKNTLAFMAIMIFISGCATRTTYLKSVDEFSGATNNISQIISVETEYYRDSRRKLSIVYFLENSDISNFNIDPSKPADSFARFVCAGYGEVEKQRAASDVLNEYGKVLNKLAEKPKDKMSIINRATLIQELLKKKPELVLKDINEDIFRKCAEEVISFIPPKANGKTIIPDPNEFGPAALLALPAIYKAAEEAINKVGSIIEDAARADAIKGYVETNSQSINNILDTLLADKWFIKANNMHNQSALYTPYLRFRVLLELPKTSSNQKLKIIDEGNQVISELKVYDQLHANAEDNSGKAIRTMRKAQEKLQSLANGKLSPEETFQVFKEYAAEMEDLVKTMNESKKQVAEALK